MTDWSETCGVLWRPSPHDPYAIEYLPVAPSAVLLDDGRPAALLLQGGGGFYVQLQAQWDPPAGALEALREARRRITGRPPRLSPPMSLQVAEAVLETGDGRGGWLEAQRVPTSGYPPYTALFAVGFDASDGAAASLALRGERGRLAVRMPASAPGLERDLRADVGSWFTREQQVAPRIVASDVRALSRSQSHR
jgi:hypothetical protein